MVYMEGTFQIGGDIQYNGAAVFLVAPGSAACATSGGVSYGVCVSNSSSSTAVSPLGAMHPHGNFLVEPRSPATTDILSILTTGASGRCDVAFSGNDGDTLIGMFYAGVPDAFGQSSRQASFSHQVTVVSSITTSSS